MPKFQQSEDAVKFTLPSSLISKSAAYEAEYRKLVEDCFDVTLGRSGWNDVDIICRPSQFARFLILRNERGIPNSFKELDPKLFIPKQEPKKPIFDARSNPNKVRVQKVIEIGSDD